MGHAMDILKNFEVLRCQSLRLLFLRQVCLILCFHLHQSVSLNIYDSLPINLR